MDRHRLLVLFILLAVSVFTCILFISNNKSLEDLNDQLTSSFSRIQSRIHTPFKRPEVLRPVAVNQTHCAYLGQKPTAEEAKEESELFSSLTWPGPSVQGLPVNLSSDPAKSFFIIQGPAEQHVGDQLVVNVYVRNFLGQAKMYGGDFLTGRLHSPKLGAGVAGKVYDHHYGNYTVLFPLLWTGEVFVDITMVHSSEAVELLKKLQMEHPDRGQFQSLFRSGDLSEVTMCKLCLPVSDQPVCNYTDPTTREPWYCYKPKMLGCDTRVTHLRAGMEGNIITKYEADFFQGGVNLKVPIRATGRSSVNVLPAKEGQTQVSSIYIAAGYYYDNIWKPLNGTEMQLFNSPSAITSCLRGKIIYLFGDSTIRQWFEFLTGFVPNLKEINLNSPQQGGPFVAVDSENNIMLSYRCHGPPLFFPLVFASELRYISNELDRIEGGSNTVIILSVGAHFNSFPIQVFIRRLRHIRRAVVQLLKREPGTFVVIRTGNMRALNFDISLSNSDWFSLQQDIVLRAMFQGLNVYMLDAWEMTLAHYLPHDIHPPHPILKNMIDLIFSQVCPVGKS